MKWRCGRFEIDLSEPVVMGVVNMTPDSFSDGGDYSGDLDKALAKAEEHLAEGARILDVGGESSRPGAAEVGVEEEMARVEPLLRRLRGLDVPVTLDTRRTEVMRMAIEADLVDGINDIEALRAPGALELLAGVPDVGICLMHMKGRPKDMQEAPFYEDVVAEVGAFLRERLEACVSMGVAGERVVLDPGIGFGKLKDHNLELLRRVGDFVEELKRPVLVGVSRKSLIRDATGEADPKKRLPGSLVVAAHQVARGASIIRAHDVAETLQAVRMAMALRGEDGARRPGTANSPRSDGSGPRS